MKDLVGIGDEEVTFALVDGMAGSFLVLMKTREEVMGPGHQGGVRGPCYPPPSGPATNHPSIREACTCQGNEITCIREGKSERDKRKK
jgi:hypothetical protein